MNIHGITPRQIDNVLRGICYWMGYRRTLYPHHRITEGAMVNELAGLLSAYLPQDLAVVLEQPLKTFGPTDEATRGRRKAVDIAIGQRESLQTAKSGRKEHGLPLIAIEVKRGSGAGWWEDLKKLAAVRKEDAVWTPWVLVLDEQQRVDEQISWVTAQGTAARRVLHCEDELSYRVRRVCRVRCGKSRYVQQAVLLEYVPSPSA